MAKQKIMFEISADSRRAITGMNRFRQSVMGVGASIAGAFGVGMGLNALVGFGKQMIDTGDQIGKMSKRFGIGTDALQKYKYMASQSGASIEAVGKSIKQMSVMIGDARTMREARSYLHRLGLSYDDIAKMKPEEQFKEIAERLGKMTDKTEQIRLATKLFGKAGVEMIPMLENYNNLAREAADQIVFSPEDVAAAEAYKDSMDRLGISLQKVVVGSGFLPWLADVADRMDKAVSLSRTMDKAQAEGMTGKGVSKMKAATDFAMNTVAAINPAALAGRALGLFDDRGEQIAAGPASFQRVETAGRTQEEILQAVLQIAEGNKRY